MPGLVWAANRVPTGVVTVALHLGAAAVTVRVANGTAWLPVGSSGLAAPIDVSAADPARYVAALPAARAGLSGLLPGQVVLSAGSAKLRRLRVGDRVAFAGASLLVKAIVAAAVIGDAEMFVSAADGRRLHLPPDRYLLVRPATASGWPAIATALGKAARSPVRILGPGKAPRLREADAVLSPLEEKLRFGEFTASQHLGSGGQLAIDPGWLAAHIVTASVPILGRVTCNKAFLPQLRSALAAVVLARLQGLVHVGDYGGCFNARLIAARVGESISHHAYGSAIDLNVSANPPGVPSAQDRRLVRIFARAGLTWGGAWLVPDGMHFEALTGSG